MSIINTKDLELFKTKTLIFFTSKPFISLCISGSLVYVVSEDSKQMVDDLRRIDIIDFPIICYDNEDLKLASKAYCIFEAMNYSALILYGNIESFHRNGLDIAKNIEEPPQYSDLLMDIDFSRLYSPATPNSLEIFISTPLVSSIGNEISVENVKTFFQDNEILLDIGDSILFGSDCCRVCALMRFLGNKNSTVSFMEPEECYYPSKAETMKSVPETVYFDALSFQTERSFDTANNCDAKASEAFALEKPLSTESVRTQNSDHYNPPLIMYNNSVSRKSRESQGYQCKCLII